jgi:type IV secretion system protein VirD4
VVKTCGRKTVGKTVCASFTLTLMTHVLRAEPVPTNSPLAELLDMSVTSGCGLYLGAMPDGAVFAPPAAGVMVLGPPRCGKTSAVVVPNVLASAGPVVSTSTKSEVMEITAPARSAMGPCYLFDPSGQVRCPPGVERVAWSPLIASHTWDGANRIALAMVEAARPDTNRGESSHWSANAKRLLACAFHSGALAGRPFGEVVDLVSSRAIDDIRSPLAVADVITALLTLDGYTKGDNREMSGIWSTASTVLAGYATDAAKKAANGQMIDPTGFAAGRGTLYICSPSDQQKLTVGAVAGLLNDVKTAAYDRWSSASQAGRVVRWPMLLALDEVANIAPLHDLPSILSEGASQGVVTLACFQDLSQARSRWPYDWEGFLTTCQSKLVFPGIADTSTLDRISRLCGQVDVEHRSTTRGPLLATLAGRGHSRSVSISSRLEPLLPVNAIAGGRPGSTLHLDGVTPEWMPAVPWFADPFLKSVVEHGGRRRHEIGGLGRDDLGGAGGPERVRRGGREL